MINHFDHLDIPQHDNAIYDSLNSIHEMNQMTFQKPYDHITSFSRLQPFIQQFYEQEQQRALPIQHSQNYGDSDAEYTDEAVSPQPMSVTPQRIDSNQNSASKDRRSYKQRLRQQLTEIDSSIKREQGQPPKPKRMGSVSICADSLPEKENTSPTSQQTQSYMNYLKLLKKDQKNPHKVPLFVHIDHETKSILVNWLFNISLIKNSFHNTEQLVDKLPRLAKSGVFFCDLINRVNGKISEPIKGINRKPNERQISHNWYKVFEYLRKHERMNPRYLYCDEVFSSNSSLYEQAFWCLLSDTYLAFQQKPVKPDQQSSKRSASQQQQQQPPQVASVPVSAVQSKRNSVKQVIAMEQIKATELAHMQRYQTRQSTETVHDQRFKSVTKSPTPCPPQLDRYHTIHNRDSNSPFQQSRASHKSQNTEVSRSPIKSISTKQNEGLKTNSIVKLGNLSIGKISQAQEKELQQWLTMMVQLGKTISGTSLFDDPYRNGLIICKLLIKLGFLRSSSSINHKPRNILECQTNWNEGLSVFTFVDQQYKKIILEKLLQGCRNSFFCLVLQIKDFYNDWMEQNQIQALKQHRKEEEISLTIEKSGISVKGGEKQRMKPRIPRQPSKKPR